MKIEKLEKGGVNLMTGLADLEEGLSETSFWWPARGGLGHNLWAII